MAWITEPLTFYAMLGAGLGLCLALFISLKRENARLRHLLEQDRRLTVGKMEEFRESMVRLQHQLEESQPDIVTAGDSYAAESPPAQLAHLHKRSLALRMHRHGETAEQIAATLNIPRNEVELLLKVHKTALEQA
ncbi:MAG: hypothetical protein HXY18_12275 [Bryobacteraceae bacterium]|nr:hypothetical protein [Bryobacteraceae bacterium]